MRIFWKKAKRKLAAALTVVMITSSITPITGLARTYDLGLISDDGEDIFSQIYKADVKATLEADGDTIIETAVGEKGSTEFKITLDVSAKVSLASDSDATGSNATGSNASASDAERRVEDVIASNIILQAYLREIDDSGIKSYLKMDETELNSQGKLIVTADMQNASLEAGTYHINLELTPGLPPSFADPDKLTWNGKQTIIPLTIVVGGNEQAEYRELAGIPATLEVTVGEAAVLSMPEWPEGVDFTSMELWTNFDGEALAAQFSEDYTTFTITADAVGTGWVGFQVRSEDNIYYIAEIQVNAVAPGAKLELDRTEVYMAPGETAEIPVEYAPEAAVLRIWVEEYWKDIVSAEYDETEKVIRITVAEDASTQNYCYAIVALYESEASAEEGVNPLAQKEVVIRLVEKQLELEGTESPEEVLDKADEKLNELLEAASGTVTPEITKLVTEVVDALAKNSDEELENSQEKIADLEEKLAAVVAYENAVDSEGVDSVEIVGATLNLLYSGLSGGKVAIKDAAVPANVQGTNIKSLDIKLQDKLGNTTITKLKMPIWIKLKIEGIDLTRRVRINHIMESGRNEWIYPQISDEQLAFAVRNFSTFVFMNYSSNGGSSSGSGGSGGSGSAGTVSTDSKKGMVNSLTGIIIGSGSGYSKWIKETSEDQTTVRWKLQYADGSIASGSYLMDDQGVLLRDEAGNPIEQPLWELIGGAWYAFGADGYAKAGFVSDPSLNGTFYVDINSGMKTGWQVIDGNWYYFNTTADGTKGLMYVNRATPDGYQVNAEGIWVQ